MPSSRPVLWISKRTLIVLALILVLAVGGIVVLSLRTNPDTLILNPAQRVARGLGTLDLYLNPDNYKSDLTWSAYQQVLAIAPDYQRANAQTPMTGTLTRYGSTLVLDRDLFGANTATALVQTFVKNHDGAVILMEFQLQMTGEGAVWKINNVTSLIKGEVSATNLANLTK